MSRTRSSITGRFVSAVEAFRSPATTVTERDPVVLLVMEGTADNPDLTGFVTISDTVTSVEITGWSEPARSAVQRLAGRRVRVTVVDSPKDSPGGPAVPPSGGGR